MFRPLEWFIGLRYLRSRRWRALVSFRTAASLLGLALGVTALIVILSVLNGLEAETRTRLLALSAHATVSAPEGFADWRELERRFATAPGVTAVTPYVRLEGMLAAGANLRPAVVRGILPAEEGAASDLERAHRARRAREPHARRAPHPARPRARLEPRRRHRRRRERARAARHRRSSRAAATRRSRSPASSMPACPTTTRRSRSCISPTPASSKAWTARPKASR